MMTETQYEDNTQPNTCNMVMYSDHLNIYNSGILKILSNI